MGLYQLVVGGYKEIVHTHTHTRAGKLDMIP